MRKRKLSPRKTARQERSRATVEAVLEATTDILVRDGYARLTTNRIAERAGVNIASLYQYFPGKEAIVAELRRRHGDEQRARVRQALAERGTGGLESTIRALVTIGVGGHAEAPRLHRVFTEELPALGYRDVEVVDASLIEMMRRFLQGAEVKVPDLDLALWMMATVSGAVIHRGAVERAEDLSTGLLTEELIRLLCRYLGAPASRPSRSSGSPQSPPRSR